MIRRITFLCLFITAQCAYPMFELEEDNHFPHELYQAAIIEKNQQRTARLCEQLGAKIINTPDRDGKTVLGYAIEKAEIDKVSMLLAVGADSNRSTHGKSPLLLAVSKGRHQVVNILCMFRATDDTSTLFRQAIEAKSPETIRALVEGGFNINIRHEALLPLHEDVFSSHEESLPLIEAVCSRNKDLVRACLDLGADKHKKDSEGRTAITVLQDLMSRHWEGLRQRRKQGANQKVISDIRDLIDEYQDIAMLLDEHEFQSPKNLRSYARQIEEENAVCVIQ